MIDLIYVMFGLFAYFAFGLLLAKFFAVYIKTNYKDMSENNQIVTILLVFVYPLVLLLGLAVGITLLSDKVLKKII